MIESDDQKRLQTFNARFPDEQACIQAFEQIRWGNPDGSLSIRSPLTGTNRVYYLPNKPGYYYDSLLDREFSLKKATVMQLSRLSYRMWLASMYLYMITDGTVSSCLLSELTGMRQPTAWSVLKRLKNDFNEVERQRVQHFFNRELG